MSKNTKYESMDLHRGLLLVITSTLMAYVGAEEICFDGLPCLSDDLRCHSAEFGFPPKTPEEINTRFFLFTRRNVNYYQELNWRVNETITSSFFRGDLPTKILIHGFNGEILDTTNSAMKDALLKAGDFNVLMVDWSAGAVLKFTYWNPWNIYYKSRQNTRVVALEIIEMLRKILSLTDTTLEAMHMVGHSLGAHIAGYVGESLPGIARITGLDAARLGFDESQGIFETECKLDPSDAEFVDVIHTDGFYGTEIPLGHQDFFPNGGTSQPGCGWSFARNLCDHVRSQHLFTESATTDCPFTGFPCNSWEKFEDRKCVECGKDDCPRLGLFADQSKARGLFWFGTNSKSPYCLEDAGVPAKKHSWFG